MNGSLLSMNKGLSIAERRSCMEAFGIIGMTFGLAGMSFGIIAFLRLGELVKHLRESGVLGEDFKDSFGL